MTRSMILQVNTLADAGAARREAANLAHRVDMDETRIGKLSIVVTEAATNLVKHAGGGQIILRTLGGSGQDGVEMLSVDNGPGMEDIGRCMEDGFSTAGSPGTGLGAMQRLSDLFDVYSRPNGGTLVLSQVHAQHEGFPAAIQIGGICLPMYDGDPCGDAWIVMCRPGEALLAVVDGLGHGPAAAAAANEALVAFQRIGWAAPGDILRQVHGPMRASRGAAMAIVRFGMDQREIRFAGVGNIAGSIMAEGATRSMVSHNGIIGHEMSRVQEFVYPWPQNSVVVLHSDGLLSRWSLDHHPGLLTHHPALAAAALFRDYRRPKDDITVIAIQPNAGEE